VEYQSRGAVARSSWHGRSGEATLMPDRSVQSVLEK
jgi:hypothetical protein